MLNSVVVTLSGLGAHNPAVTLDPLTTKLTATVNIADDDSATVSLAKLSDGSESGTHGAFRVTQTQVSSSDTVVNYSIGGTASNGVDYVLLPNSVVIPAGQRAVLIPVVPRDDGPPDITSTVVLRLAPRKSTTFRIALDLCHSAASRQTPSESQAVLTSYMVKRN